MHIVHYIKWLRLEDGGTVRFVLDLSDALVRAGHTVTILTCDGSGAPAAWKSGGPRIVELRIRDVLRGRMPRGAGDFPTQLLPADARKIVRDTVRSADAVHLHGVWAISNSQVARIARSEDVRTVVTPHGMLDTWSMSQRRLAKRLFLMFTSGPMMRRATAVQFTARAEAAQAAEHVTVPRPRVVPPPVELSAFREIPDRTGARKANGIEDPDVPLLLFLSRVHRKKGVERLLEASARLRARSIPHRVAIVGPSDPPGYAAQLRMQADRLGIADWTVWPGMVQGEAKRRWYAAADLFVLPTSQENFGYVLIEAMAAGLPVVTTRGVDIWPELKESGGAEIVENDPGALADMIERLLADRASLRARGEAGRAWCFERMDPERIIDQYEAMYGGA